jgi:crotonobetainyl-CoA:carnitine CoA-transferase CaiB-like acyl-CoA transferase
MSKLQKHGIPASAVMNSREVLTDPHMNARGFYEKITHSPDSGIGTKLYFGRPWKMSGTPSFIRRPAPTLGEHNEDILGNLLGKTQTEIEKLYQVGVLGKVPEIPPTYRPPSIDKQIEDGTLRGFDIDYRKIVGLE